MATTAMKPAALSGRIIAAFIDGLILVVPFVILLQDAR
jgi:hypothetical protein